MIPMRTIEGVRLPDFSMMAPSDWDQALDAAYRQAESDGLDISANAQAPTFDNTFRAMERRMQRLWQVLSPFTTVQTADNTPAMQEIAERWLPRIEAQSTRLLDANLAERCQQALDTSRDLDAVDLRLAHEVLGKFKRAGAFLDAPNREKFLELNEKLSELGMLFSKIHQDNSNATILVDGALSGVEALFAQNARDTAIAMGHPGKAAIAMNSSEVETITSQAHDRAIRKAVWEAFANRGTGRDANDTDTSPIVSQMLSLRQQMAELLGYGHWADRATESRMAKTGQAALAMVDDTWQQLAPMLARDTATVLEFAQANGHDGELAPWDIDYWLARVRQSRFSVDETELSQFLPLPIVRAGAFATASALFGVSFEPADVASYHEDATPFLVRDRDGSALGMLFIDDAIRPTKSSGAWMEQMMVPDRLDGTHLPVVVNVCNFPSPSPGRPALVSMWEATTAFHELGHALHSLLTTARYPTQAGVMVYGDFVELQSQLLENWIREPQTLSHIAQHWQTGQSMPIEMARQVRQAMDFGKSFDQARYLMSCKIDLLAHMDAQACLAPVAFEAQVASRMQAPACVAPRHRLTQFTHLFAGAMGSEYSAGYYSYLWAEVLEADAFEAFSQSGNLLDETLGRLARDTLYARGNEVEPGELYRQFRGRDPDPSALLRRMGAQETAKPQPSRLRV